MKQVSSALQTMPLKRANQCRSLVLSIRRPQGQIVAQQLHDESGILVRILRNVVQLSDGILESRAGHLASLIWIRQYFVLEDRVVQRQAQTDGMGHNKTLLSNFVRLLISLTGTLCGLGLAVSVRELSNVTPIVCLHLLVEHLGLILGSLGNQILVEQTEDRVADLLELRLDLLTIFIRPLGVLIIAFALLLVLHTGDDTPRGSAAAHRVLVRDGQQIALLHSQLLGRLAHFLHVVCHLVVALRLFGQLGEVHVLSPRHCDATESTRLESRLKRRTSNLEPKTWLEPKRLEP